MHPFGTCCQVERPTIQNRFKLRGILLRSYLKSKSNLIEGYEMYLSDNASSSLIERNRFNIDGSPLKTPAKVEGYGYKLYNVKIKEDVYLENDPQFSCRNYKDITYEKVTHSKLCALVNFNFSVFKMNTLNK